VELDGWVGSWLPHVACCLRCHLFCCHLYYCTACTCLAAR
jgi:hypothetical protein